MPCPRGPVLLGLSVLLTAAACKPSVLISRSGQAPDASVGPEREPDAGTPLPPPTLGPGPSLPPAIDGGGSGDAGLVATPSACPGGTAMPPASCAALGVVVAPAYAAFYSCFDLGPVPGLPMHKYGGLTLTRDACSDTLLIGGDANLQVGKLYAIKVRRDPGGHISGFEGAASPVADAPYIDGGVAYGPGGVLFFTRYPTNQLQQTRPGSTVADKTTELFDLGVEDSSASLGFVPSNLPGGGAFKLVSWPNGQWHTLGLTADPTGTYDVAATKSTLTLPGGPEGFVYVAAGSPLFTVHSLLVSEWTANTIGTYQIDQAGDPVLGTRRDFITGLQGAEGAYRDPATGDFFFSTWGQTLDRVIVVRGFAPITID
jgi:hypothetical protein